MATELIIDAKTGQIEERSLTSEQLAKFQASDEELATKKAAEIKAARYGAYAIEADPLFFGPCSTRKRCTGSDPGSRPSIV